MSRRIRSEAAKAKNREYAKAKYWRLKNSESPEQRQARLDRLKSYRQENQERIRLQKQAWHKTHQRRLTLKKYGLTEKQFGEMSEAQNNRCAICLRSPELVVDHCHTTLRVRGLLCAKCNTGLGMLSDDINKLKRGIAYLERFA